MRTFAVICLTVLSEILTALLKSIDHFDTVEDITQKKLWRGSASHF